MDREYWIDLQHPDVHDGYMISSIGRIKTKDESCFEKPARPSYHSTNGYDYFRLLNKELKIQLFPADELVAIGFILIPNNLQNKPRVVKHLDGNNRNNNASNLEWVEDIEEWRNIVDDMVAPDRYMVSSFGRFYDKLEKKYINPNIGGNGYMLIDMAPSDYAILIGKKYKVRSCHRFIAKAFVNNPDPKRLNIINHIDGSRDNNHLINLEWVSQRDNVHHAIDIGITPVTSTETLDHIRDMLIKYNGSPTQVYNNIDHELYPDVTLSKIKHIKAGDVGKNRTNKFDLSTLKFDKCDNREISVEVLDDIRDMLIEENGSVKAVLDRIDKVKYPYINYDFISSIKFNKSHQISNKFDLTKINFRKCSKRLTIDEVDMVRDKLVKYDGNVGKAYDDIDHQEHPYITREIMFDIRSGKSYNKSNKYNLSELTFKRIKTFDADKQDMVRDLLKEYGSVKNAYEHIDHEKYPNISIHMVAQVLSGKRPEYCKTNREVAKNGKD